MKGGDYRYSQPDTPIIGLKITNTRKEVDLLFPMMAREKNYR